MYINALVYGCTHEEFWDMDPRIYFWKEEVFELKIRAEFENSDQTAWMIGAYVLEAIGTAFSDNKKPHYYPGYPKFVESMDEGLAEERRLAELVAIRDAFLARSRMIGGDNTTKIQSEPLMAPDG